MTPAERRQMIVLGGGLHGVFAFVAMGIVSFSAILGLLDDPPRVAGMN